VGDIMAKYGTQKYGTFKYGVTIDAGSGSITPSGAIAYLKVYLRNVGEGIVTISKNFSKDINKLIGSASMSITGDVNKLTSKLAGNGIVAIAGHAAKTLLVNAGEALLSSIGSVSKQISKITGQGSVTISGVIDKLKYYFFVTADMILQPLGLLITKINRSLMPPTRENTEEIPGRHGEIDFGSEFGSDMIELEVATDDGLTAAEIESTKRTLAQKLNPAVGERDLVLEYEKDKNYKVKYAGRIPLDRFPTWMKFVIPFKILNPFANAVNEKTLTGNGAIINDGTFETGLIIEIAGAVTNPSVIIGSVTLAYTGTIAVGQKLIIDTEAQTAKIGSSNAMAGYNGEFPLLQPGSVNITAGSNVTVKWKDKYL
jgi:predicted phage tail component-like protein